MFTKLQAGEGGDKCAGRDVAVIANKQTFWQHLCIPHLDATSMDAHLGLATADLCLC